MITIKYQNKKNIALGVITREFETETELREFLNNAEVILLEIERTGVSAFDRIYGGVK